MSRSGVKINYLIVIRGGSFCKNLMIITSAISIEGFCTEGFTFLISHFLENMDL